MAMQSSYSDVGSRTADVTPARLRLRRMATHVATARFLQWYRDRLKIRSVAKTN